MAAAIYQKWREWVPLTGVLDQLPQQFQQGVDTAHLQITCIASLPKHLVLGTNIGVVYLAHLPTASLLRLKCENPLSPITSVGTVSTVDEMIAAGSLDGTITIFQLPRVTGTHGSSSAGPESAGTALPQPVMKRFTVGRIHRTKITSFTWSCDGMRLFCGDAQGIISQIDIDYQTSECSTKELFRESYTIVQLSYSFQLLAVSTLERTLIYDMKDESVVQVGKKARKHLGVFGCIWTNSESDDSSVLFSSRPGLRMWSAKADGEVQQTHIIKELPESSQIQLLEPCGEKTRKGENFAFGILYHIDSYLLAYNPHWLFIVDISNLKVCNFSGQFGRIIDVAVSGNEIFVLDGSRHITCLSIEPPDIGERKIVAHGPGNFLEAENLKELKSRILSQGTDILGQIARVGSTVAAKVTEHAKPSIVAGQEIKSRQYSDASSDQEKQNLSGGLSEHGHRRSSSSGFIPEPQRREGSPNLIPPRMVQSVSNLLPSLLSPQSLVRTFGKTPPMNEVIVPEVSQSQVGFEEMVTSSQIVAAEGAEQEPLVLRDKPRKKAKKKQGNASPESGSSKLRLGDQCVSGNDLSESSSPCATPLSCTSTDKNTPESDDFLVEVSKKLSDKENNDPNVDKVDASDGAIHSSREKTTFGGAFHLGGGLDSQNVDTRTYEDFKTSIEKKESLLAEILDLGCLKMDHEAKSVEKCNEGDFGSHIPYTREHSYGSTGCSTPSTLKEQSPLPNSVCDDFLEGYYRNNVDLNSDDENLDVSSEKKKGSTDDNSSNCSIASNDGGERLGSNFSEDRSSCLSYGPPSGSSLVSLPGNRVPFLEGHDSHLSESSAMFVVTDSSEIADISWSYSTAQDLNPPDSEELAGGWLKQRLPGNVISFSVSDKMIAFLDSQGCLFCKQNNLDSWKKYKLTAKATRIAQSPNGATMWVLYGTSAYAVQVPVLNLESLQLAKMTLVARKVLQLSVDNELTWYIKDDSQVCAVPNTGGKLPCHVSCEEFQLVKIVAYAKVVWGLTDKGQVAFRIGMNATSQLGHAWGLMKGPSSPVKEIALGPGCMGWIMDVEGNVYFRPGVCAEYPQGQDLKWWQVLTSDYMIDHASEKSLNIILEASREGTWITERGSDYVFFFSGEFKGHGWNVFGTDSWSTVCAEGIYNDQGAICCLSPKGQLFVINPNTKSSVPLDVVSNECIVSVSQRPETMWVLTAAGDIYIRVGLSAQSLLGTWWEQLDLHQISDVHLCHLSCGTEVVWSVDTRGGVYMRQGPLSPPPLESLPPAWIQVDQTPLKGNAVFTKVYVGMKTHMVWALDSNHHVYVREAIFPEIPIGISWVPVPGLLALQLSISESEVYALTLNGEIFKRTGVTEINYIGDIWEKIPGNVARISVTTDNRLWGLNSDGQICCHETFLSNDTSTNRPDVTQDVFLSDESEDWEML